MSQGFFEIVKVVKPVKTGLNPKWELWKLEESKDAKGQPFQKPIHVDSVEPERLPPHVRKALHYDTRAHFQYGKDGDKHTFGSQVRNHRW